MLRTPATAILLAANLVIFLLMAGSVADVSRATTLVQWGGNLGKLTLNGEEWRLVTALFVHGGFGHVAGNLICLLAWGSLTEIALGTPRFLLLYLLSGIVANLASAWVNPSVVSVGASGAIAGILGLMVVMWLARDERISAQGLAANIALNAFVSFLPAVDWVAHVAGFASGLALGPLLFRGASVQLASAVPEQALDRLGPLRRPAFAVSFQDPMNFPAGTKVYRTRSRLVAILPDWTLIADDGAGGAVFATADDYREAVFDEDHWSFVKEL